DSEVIYQLINFCNPSDGVTYEGLKAALEDTLLRGVFALAFVNKNTPNLLHIVKQERPMDLIYWEEAGVLFYNSDKKYIHTAFQRINRSGKRFGFYFATTLKEIKLEENKYITIDANAESLETMI